MIRLGESIKTRRALPGLLKCGRIKTNMPIPMKPVTYSTSRRSFLKTSIMSGICALAGASLPTKSHAQGAARSPKAGSSRVSLTSGEDRADLTFRSLRALERDIADAIGRKRVIIKPNNVAIDQPLCASHAGQIEGILEFLKSIGIQEIAIAESAASGSTLEGFSNYGYNPLAQKYGAKLIDLDQDAVELLYACDEKDFHPRAIRVAKTLLDPSNFVISAAKLKTHDRVVATLSLKNIVVGAPIKDLGFRWGQGSKPGAKNDKPLTHGSGFRAINYNLFAMAFRLHPHLAVIDGFEGMEGNGPVGGTPVHHRVALASLDWLAADRVGAELMGIDFSRIGYLNYCARAGMGEADMSKMEILGQRVTDHVKPYKLSDNIEKQLVWMQRTES
jgi:uncharacterized protein (DUF362 family)